MTTQAIVMTTRKPPSNNKRRSEERCLTDAEPRKRRSSVGRPSFVLELPSGNAETLLACQAKLPPAPACTRIAASFARRRPKTMKVVLKGDQVLGFGLITNAHGRVTTVIAGTAAEGAGIQPYDRILQIDDSAIDSESGALALLSSLARGEAEFTIERPPELQRAAIAEKENALGSSPFGSRRPATRTASGAKQLPSEDAAALPVPGERRAVVTRAEGESLGVQYRMVAITRGQKQSASRCMVTSVIPGGPADRAGLMPGDIIREIDGKKLDGPLRAFLDRPKSKEATQFVLSLRRVDLNGESGAKTSLSDARVVHLSADL